MGVVDRTFSDLDVLANVVAAGAEVHALPVWHWVSDVLKGAVRARAHALTAVRKAPVTVGGADASAADCLEERGRTVLHALVLITGK